MRRACLSKNLFSHQVPVLLSRKRLPAVASECSDKERLLFVCQRCFELSGNLIVIMFSFRSVMLRCVIQNLKKTEQSCKLRIKDLELIFVSFSK